MNLLLFMLLWMESIAINPWAANLSLAAFAEDKPLVEIIRSAVKDAVKADGGKQQPRDRPAAPRPLAVPPVQGPEQDKQEIHSRLAVYGNAMRHWLEQTCGVSNEQRTKLQELLKEKSANEYWWREGADIVNIRQERGLQVFGNCFPILFTMKTSGLASNFQEETSDAISSMILTVDQQQRWTDARDERTQFQSAAFREYILSLLDKELFLTSDQRAKISADLIAENRVFDHGLYSFQSQPHYFHYKSIATVIPSGIPILNAAQQKRLNDLRTNALNQNRYVTFDSSVGMEGWYKQIDELGLEQREVFLRAVAVRVAYYEAEMGISSEQSNLLTVAGKGAAVSAVASWKETTRATAEQMEQQMLQVQGNFAFSAQKMSLESLDKDRIWLNTLKSVLTDKHAERARNRSEAIRSARANAVVAMLDQELWLRPDQRKPLRELVETTLPSGDVESPYQEYLREIILLAHPLFRIPDVKINAVLEEPQQAAWKQLKTYFRPQGNDALSIPLKMHGGEMGIQLSH